MGLAVTPAYTVHLLEASMLLQLLLSEVKLSIMGRCAEAWPQTPRLPTEERVHDLFK